MTITMDDVECFIGLPCSGSPLEIGADRAAEPSRHLVMRLLGVTAEEAEIAHAGANSPTIKLEWLRGRFQNVDNVDDRRVIKYSARAYLLYLLGCTIFTDKIGSRIATKYLHFLENITEIRNYAWGAGALAYLYRQLGLASRADVKQFAGYSTLLESWVYQHFTSLRPLHNMSYQNGEPLAMMWIPEAHPGASIAHVIACRERLDYTQIFEVVWCPYNDLREHFPLNVVTLYRGCIVALEYVEPYHPERVLRQFGYVQTIPEDSLAPEMARRGRTAEKYKVLWGTLGSMFRMWDIHVLNDMRLGRNAVVPWECAPEYIEWYTQISHPIVQCPRYSSAYQGIGSEASTTTQLGDRILSTRDTLEPLIDRWESGDSSLTTDTIMPTVRDAYLTVEGLSLEEYNVTRRYRRGPRIRGGFSRSQSSRQM